VLYFIDSLRYSLNATECARDASIISFHCITVVLSAVAVTGFQSKSPLLKSGTPQYFDRLGTGRGPAGGRGQGFSRASSVGAGPVPRRPSTISPSPPPPPSTPSRRLQQAQARQKANVGGQQEMQKALEQQVEMLEAELRRKKKIAAAATLAASAAADNERKTTSGKDDKRASSRLAVGVWTNQPVMIAIRL